MKKIHDAARWYARNGFSVIPVKANKHPMLKTWKPFQETRADEAQVADWWRKWPDAGVAIVTGEISDLVVVDVDSEAGHEALREFLPDSLETPIARTPSGGYHYFFKYRPGLTSRARAGVTDCDVRTDGGYVVAAPSLAKYKKGGRAIQGGYQWLDGLSLGRVEPAALPDILFDVLAGGDAQHAEAPSGGREHASKKGIYHYPYIRGDVDGQKMAGSTSVNTKVNKRQQGQQSQHLIVEGGRDEALFHLANCLARGGMDEANLLKYLLLFATKCCSPPFPESEARAKVQSALKRAESRSTNLTANIREFLASTSGNISSTEIIQASTKSTFPEDRRKISAILSRMVRDGEIERVNGQNGLFRRVETECETMNFLDADTETADIWLPFNLHKMVETMPGNIIVVAGEPNAGKTGLMLNIIQGNMDRHEIHYFNSEMGGSELKKRLSLFDGISLKQWKFNAWERADRFEDVIKHGKGTINIIDFLEIHDEMWRVSGQLAAIHKKLKGAIAIVALQKNPGVDTGLGGYRSLEKPRLYLAMAPHCLKIVKAKNWKSAENPNGQQVNFKVVKGCNFIQTRGWHRPQSAA